MRLQHLFPAAIFILLIATAASDAHAAPPSSCAQHADCGATAFCNRGQCEVLGQLESFMSLTLTRPAPAPAYLFIDGANMGTLPWEGILTPGAHSIRVECQGMQPLELQGTSTPGAAEMIALSLEPLPGGAPAVGQEAGAPPTQPPPQPESADRGVPGTVFVAASGGIGLGTAFAEGWSRPATTLLVGGSAGFHLPKIPIWIDLGVAAGGTFTRIKDFAVDGEQMGFGDFVKLDLGLLVRVLFPLKKNFIYLGGEIEPGFAISNQNFIYAGVRGALSIFPNPHLEIRINPIGAEFVQGLAKDAQTGYIISYQATVGLAIRFP